MSTNSKFDGAWMMFTCASTEGAEKIETQRRVDNLNINI